MCITNSFQAAASYDQLMCVNPPNEKEYHKKNQTAKIHNTHTHTVRNFFSNGRIKEINVLGLMSQFSSQVNICPSFEKWMQYTDDIS